MKIYQCISSILLVTGMILFNNIPVQALGTTWYVSATGSNSNNCLTWATACNTIQGAIDKATDGDTVNIGAGTYNENVILNKDVNLTGTGMYATIVDANGVAKPLLIMGGVTTVVQKMAFTDSGYDYTDNMGNGGIFILGEGSNVTITQSRIYNNAGPGIISFGAHIITNNLFENNGTADAFPISIFLSSGSTAVVKNNTLIDNTQLTEGIYVHPTAISASILNNIIVGFSLGVVLTETNSPPVSLSHNNYWGNSVNYYNITAGVGDIYTDPLFADRANGNYHLNQCSPAVDAGDPTSDYSNEPSPNGGRINLGAYGGTSEAAPTVFSKAECEALLALYNSTDGANWTDNTGWLRMDTPCNWHGITCAGGKISEINLGNNNLSGSIPVELGNLLSLTSLGLHQNKLIGNIPIELTNLVNLTGLYLWSNQLTGAIPPEIGNLSKLEAIALGGNQLSGNIPPELGNLPQLWSLQIQINNFSGPIPPELGNLTNLDSLFLGSNQLSGNIPPELANLTKLTRLSLDRNQLTGSIPPELGDLTQLEWLVLSNNQLSNSIPVELGSLSSLTSLKLQNNQLSGNIPPELGNLSNLSTLYLYTNQLSGAIPPELGNLSQLDWLSLCENQLSGSIPASLGSLSQLQMLDICDNQLSGSIPPEIINLSQLTILDINGNQLTGNLPDNIGNLTNLEYLATMDNSLSGTIPASIVNLTNLYYIDISCGLTTTDPAVIAFLNAKNPDWKNNCSNPPPTVLSIVRANANPANATSISFTVTFSESVTGVNINAPSDFNLSTTGVTGASISGISGTGATRTVTVNTGSGSGTIRLELIDDDSIKDSTSKPLGGAGAGNGDFTAGQTYTIDKTTPTVLSSIRTGSNPTKDASVDFTVTFSETVTGVTLGDFSLTTSGVTGATINSIRGSGRIYTITISTGNGSGVIQLNVVDDDTITNIISKPLGGSGIGNGNFMNGETYNIDKTAPTVSSITHASPISIGNYIVTFSESVTGVDMIGPAFDDFTLTTSPSISGASITGVSGSGTTYAVTVDIGSGHGTIRLDVPNTANISDLVGNPLADLPFTSGESYTITMSTYSSIAANDGWTLESSEYSSRANARNNSGYLLVGDDAKNKQYRSLLYFDTATLPDNAVIINMTLKVMQAGVTGTNPFTTHGALFAEMKNGIFGKSPLENTDFQAVPYPKRSVGTFSPVSGEPGWYQLVLNPANYKYVNLNGVTQFRIRFTKDDDNDKVADFISFYSGDDATNPPQLIIEYVAP